MIRNKQILVDSDFEINGYQLKNAIVHTVEFDIDASAVEGQLSYSLESDSLFVGDGINPQIVGGNLSFSNVPHIGFDVTLNNPEYQEGKIFYDKTKKTLSYYNEESDVTVNLGQENIVKVKNNTGLLIPNGAVVTGLASDSGIITIQLANAKDKHRSRFIGMATMDIADGATGYVTAFGEVGGLDTSSYAAGTILYVATTDGDYTDTPPDDGAYAIVLGMIVVSDAVNGSIIVNPTISELTVEVTDTNGFPDSQKAGTTISVDNGTRTFSITPTGADFHFYVLGDKFEKEGVESIVFPDSEGTHWFYFDNTGVLNTVYNPTPAQISDIILNQCFIAEIYWNATDKKVEFDVFDERHGISMSPKTHIYLHRTRGAQFVSGYGLDDFAIGIGTLATDSQFSVADGNFVDEDIDHNFAGTAVGDTIDVTYIEGTNPNFRSATQTGYAFLNAPAGRVYWNQLSGITWQLTEAANDSYVLYHIFGINGVNKQVASVVGQTNYSSITNARLGASSEISNIKAGFALPETVPVATFILQTRNTNVTGKTGTWSRSGTTITVTSANHNVVVGEVINVTTIDGSQTTGNKTITAVTPTTFTFTGVGSGNTTGSIVYTTNAFTNATYSRLVKTEDGDNYVDWRTTELAQGVNPSSHANLTNVLQAGSGVQDGHISDQDQTLYGVKTFNDGFNTGDSPVENDLLIYNGSTWEKITPTPGTFPILYTGSVLNVESNWSSSNISINVSEEGYILQVISESGSIFIAFKISNGYWLRFFNEPEIDTDTTLGAIIANLLKSTSTWEDTDIADIGYGAKGERYTWNNTTVYDCIDYHKWRRSFINSNSPKEIATDMIPVHQKAVVSDNSTVVIPYGYSIMKIISEVYGTTGGNISAGTADGLSDIISSTALSTVDGGLQSLPYIELDSMLSKTANKAIYFNIDTATEVRLHITLQKTILN